ncbi:YcxB family protein [Psychromonas ossibalaenae]|uniref:YcxB family protein n=1 Tax=Psychromonas ossibalaenae TaxID=444922 RepID=UPI00037D4D9E|nr:YcxB family protein [Psychromonas ossibalaenae]
MQFESEFTLNRQHFEECFDQSLPFTKNKNPRYKFMAALLLGGLLIVIFIQGQKTLGFFLMALAGLEYFSFRYKRTWWLTRQMWSKNSGNTIKLTIDEQGVKINSLYNNTQLQWSEVAKVDETPKGLMLTLENGALNYLSKAVLNEQVSDFIKQHNKNA